jgi:hypothetical protein
MPLPNIGSDARAVKTFRRRKARVGRNSCVSVRRPVGKSEPWNCPGIRRRCPTRPSSSFIFWRPATASCRRLTMRTASLDCCGKSAEPSRSGSENSTGRARTRPTRQLTDTRHPQGLALSWQQLTLRRDAQRSIRADIAVSPGDQPEVLAAGQPERSPSGPHVTHAQRAALLPAGGEGSLLLGRGGTRCV